MADPRNTVSFDGVDGNATFLIDGSTITYDGTKEGGSAQVGLAVTLSASKTIALTADGDSVLGELKSVEWDGTAHVQIAGCVTLPGGNGAALSVGAPIVGALGPSNAKGYIRQAAAPSGAYAQAEVRDARNGRGRILDITDTTQTVVHL